MRIALYAPRFATAHTPQSIADIIRKSEADLFIGSEYLLVATSSNKAVYPLLLQERAEYLDAIADASKGRIVVPGSMLWTRGTKRTYPTIKEAKAAKASFFNSAPLFADGTLAGERYKRWDSDMEVPTFENAWNLPYSPRETHPIIRANGRDIRIDICIDYGYISDTYAADIHVLTAANYGYPPFACSNWLVKDGGLALFVDCGRDKANERRFKRVEARRYTDGKFLHCPQKDRKTTLRTYEVEI